MTRLFWQLSVVIFFIPESFRKTKNHMARSRNIKPSFFTNDILSDCQPLARLLFIGLWTIADREGRLEDRPKKVKAEILPYDNCDIGELLNTLQMSGFIVRYKGNDNNSYIQILNFTKHQNPHQKEANSTIPAPDLSGASTGISDTSRALTLNPLPDSPIPQQERTINPDSVVIDNREKDKFRNIYEFGINIFPQLAPKNTAEITKWVEAGVIPAIDVYPAIRQATAKNVQSWSYFSGAVMDAKANRLKPLPKGNENGIRQRSTETIGSQSDRAAEAIARGIAKSTIGNTGSESTSEQQPSPKGSR